MTGCPGQTERTVPVFGVGEEKRGEHPLQYWDAGPKGEGILRSEGLNYGG